MATIDDTTNEILDLLEELRSTPKFWSVPNELRPIVAEAMFEMSLITGEPEIRAAASYAVAANQNLQTMPSGVIAITRMESGTQTVEKCSLYDLDKNQPGWEAETGTAVKKWFPYGLGQFGVYPKVSSPVNVVLTSVSLPVTVDRPYTGAEVLPFQDEYMNAFSSYGAHVARLKEGGIDFFQSMVLYDQFLAICGEMSRFSLRKDSLRFTKYRGAVAKVTEVKSV